MFLGGKVSDNEWSSQDCDCDFINRGSTAVKVGHAKLELIETKFHGIIIP